jgi:hypothetical protein
VSAGRKPAGELARELAPAGVALVLLLVVGLVVLARGGGADGGESQRLSPIRLASLEGNPVRLPTGHPGAVIFADSTCSGVVPAAQGLADLKQRFGDRVEATFISIYPADSRSALARISASIGDPYPFAIDASGELARRYRIATTGTVLVYDRHGEIVDRMIEPFGDELAAAVEAELTG